MFYDAVWKIEAQFTLPFALTTHNKGKQKKKSTILEKINFL